MKKIFITAFLLAAVGFSFAQKTVYDPNAVLREVKGFHAIKVSDGIDLFLTYGDEAVAVSASETKFVERIKTVVENGVLKLSYEEQGRLSWNTNRKLKAYVSYKTLTALSASGGCDVTVEGSIKTMELSIGISGGSDFKGKIEVGKLNIDQSGGSDVDVSGKAETVSISASGGSDFNGYNLATDVCSVEASGGSDVEITVNRELTARASGASDISYKGAASVKESKASGASSVSHKS
jgi:hypothetical protein